MWRRDAPWPLRVWVHTFKLLTTKTCITKQTRRHVFSKRVFIISRLISDVFFAISSQDKILHEHQNRLSHVGITKLGSRLSAFQCLHHTEDCHKPIARAKLMKVWWPEQWYYILLFRFPVCNLSAIFVVPFLWMYEQAHRTTASVTGRAPFDRCWLVPGERQIWFQSIHRNLSGGANRNRRSMVQLSTSRRACFSLSVLPFVSGTEERERERAVDVR